MDTLVTYEILQLPKKEKNLLFKHWGEIKDKFNIKCYENIYKSEIIDLADRHELLEQLFIKFNIRHPKDFKGHSLSISDIVKVHGRYYYCDFCGWEDITDKIGV